jgi:hypothetical protein
MEIFFPIILHYFHLWLLENTFETDSCGGLFYFDLEWVGEWGFCD